MEVWLYLVTIFGSVMASGGFWTLIQKRMDKKDLRTKLLLGIAHDRIFYLAIQYLDRGSITKEEYINFNKYLAEPYFELGGNGVVTTIVQRVLKLPLTNDK